MGLRILYDRDENAAVLFDDKTKRCIGSVFIGEHEEDARQKVARFLRWFESDPRFVTTNSFDFCLDEFMSKWRRCGHCEGRGCDEGKANACDGGSVKR